LDWYRAIQTGPNQLSYNLLLDEPKTLNQHFAHLFPPQTAQFGQAFLEVALRDDTGQIQTTPVCLNHDAFAASLSDPELGLDVVYYEPDMQFYYKEPFLNIYKPVSGEKLQGLYRGLLMRSAGLLKTTNAKLNIWAELRSDKNARLVVQRAKSILAADSTFFSATSSHQRVRGQELTERVARRFVDEMLTGEPGQILRLADAYAVFRGLLKLRDLPDMRRSEFKAVVAPLVRDQFNLGLRNDLISQESQVQQCGWKGLRLGGVAA
jgi:hypothetical protein